MRDRLQISRERFDDARANIVFTLVCKPCTKKIARERILGKNSEGGAPDLFIATVGDERPNPWPRFEIIRERFDGSGANELMHLLVVE
jgi:hypothetical protein